MDSINNLIDLGKEIDLKVEREILNTESELLFVLLAHRSKNTRILENLRIKNPMNWYVIHGIAINLHTSPSTLLKLVKPEHKIQKELYAGFGWRNVRLYVAKNKMADSKTLNYIINCKNSRPMDIEAARHNLAMKKNSIPQSRGLVS
jgi:hypothetical protein